MMRGFFLSYRLEIERMFAQRIRLIGKVYISIYKIIGKV